MTLLQVRDLHIHAGDKALVQGVSFDVQKGKTLAVVGESGSGKTLTSLAVMGLLGEGLVGCADKMLFNGEELQKLRPEARRRLRGTAMSMIFQEPATALNPVLTCGAQVAEAYLIHTAMGGAERKARVMDLFRKVKLPEPERIWGSYPHESSGGQRQRVMIAMALAHKPQLLIADEPTTALDVTVQAEILALVKELQRELGMAMLWITHDFGVVRALADDVLVLRHGKMVETGTVKQVFGKPRKPYTRELLETMPVLKVSGFRSQVSGRKGKPILEASRLSHTYGGRGGWWPFGKKAAGVHALQNVSLEVFSGRTLGVVGESGSGKSTLARVLTRLVEVEKGGKVVFLGKDFAALEPEALRLARRDMQMVFQDPSAALNPKMRVGESVAEGIRAHRTMPEREVKPYVAKLLKDCGLPEDAAGRYPHQFSGGQRQRICIARALALEPKLLICDEAVSALDVSVQAQILALLEKLQRERGMAMVFISHDLRVVSHLADEVLVMHKGRVVESGPTPKVLGKPQKPYTKRLVSAVI
jgi:peptide/nickel transport system ATP-binding protein